jgi:hypothetical protein
VEGAFAWLGSMMEYIGQFIPHLYHIQATHTGVKFVRGKAAVKMTPGVYLYWPLTTNIMSYPIGRQAFVLRPQTCTTADDKTIVFSFVLSYTVFDGIALLGGRVWEPDETFEEICLGLSNHVIVSKTWEELKRAHADGSLAAELKQVARRELRKFGVNVRSANPTDLAPCKVIKLMGNAKVLQA